MTSVAYRDMPGPSYARVLWGVVCGLLPAALLFAVVAVVLGSLHVVDSELVMPRPGPYVVDGPWSLAADLVCVAVVVGVTASWIRSRVAAESHLPVSLPIVVAVVGAAALLLVIWPRPAAALVALLAGAWAIKAFAVGSGLTVRVPGWAWLAATAGGLAILGSYAFFHPLVGSSTCGGSDDRGRTFFCLELRNAGLTGVTITAVEGATLTEGFVQGPPLRTPATLHARDHAVVYAGQTGCKDPVVRVTYRTLGLTHTKRFQLRRLDC